MCALEPRVLFSYAIEYTAGGTPVPAGLPTSTPPPASSTGTGSSSGNLPLGSVPVINSRAGAKATLYLDFTGANVPAWGSYLPGVVPAYDEDGDPSTFSLRELADIQQIVSRVAEAYSPFNVNVTTVDPGVFPDNVAERIVIGGDGAWAGGHFGGLSYTGSFVSSMPNTGFVFSSNLNGGDAKDTGEAASHEAGHGFGLSHQALYDGVGTKLNEYNTGNPLVAPFMGNSYGAQRAIWWQGPTPNSADDIQDDVATIGGATNGFGFASDLFGHAPATATPLPEIDGLPSVSGVIVSTNDVDVFSFTAAAGTDTFTLNVAPDGPMLHAKLEILAPDGTVLATADASTLGQTVSATLPAGQYELAVMSHGSYGDIGQYSVTGTLAATSPAPTPPVTPPATTPGTPAALPHIHLTAAANGRGSLLLRWKRVTSALAYRLTRSVDGVKWKVIAQLSGRGMRYVDGRLSASVIYHYRLRAMTAAGSSISSRVIAAQPTGARRTAAVFAIAPIALPVAAALPELGSAWDEAEGWLV